MAKSKKSKILAMALCASVMTGIYASPVMAGQISGITLADGSTTLVANDQIYINGVELSGDAVKAAGGEFTQLTVTNGMEITGGILTVGGTSIDSTNGNTVVGGTLTANGAANLKGGLSVTGGATVNGGLTVNNTATVNGMLTASDGLTVTNNGIKVEEGGLTVDMGDTVLNDLSAGTTTLDRLTVTDGQAKFKQGAFVEGQLYADQAKVGAAGLEVVGDTTLKSTLKVDGQTTLNGLTAGATTVDSLGVTNNATVNGTLTAGATTVDSLGVTNNATVNGTLTAGATTVDSLKSNGNAEVGGTLNVTDKLTANNGLKVTNGTETDTLTVTGAAKVNSLEVANSATVGDKLTVGNGLDVTGNALLNNDLTVNGATKLNGDVTVGGEAKFNEKATFNGKAIFNENIDVNGFANLNSGAKVNGELTVNGATKVNNDLTVNGNALVNGSLDIRNGKFKVDADGNTEFIGNLNINHGNFTVDAVTGDTVVKGKLNLGSLDGREVGEAIKGLEAYTEDLKDADLPGKVEGIDRDPVDGSVPNGEGVTTIEGMAKFDSEGMTIGETVVNDGKITVGAAADNQTIIDGGVITAKRLELNGKDVGKTIFGIEREDDVTTIEGATSFDANGMSIKDDDGFGTSLGVAGMEITAAGGLSTSFTAGGATFVGASGTTTINGGAIETTTINGVNFTQWHDEVDGRLDDLEYKTQNIKPGTGTGTGTGEGGTAAGESNNIIEVPATEDGHTGINGNVTVGGEINAGEIVVGDKDTDNKTIIDGGNITVNGGENGSTTINGGNITTGETTIDGDGIDTVNGNFTGEVTVGDGTTSTTITGEGITTGDGTFTGDVDITGNITADTGNIGNVDMDNTGITVGDGTTITGEGINTGTGTFDDVIIGGNTTIDSDGIKTNDITADTGTIGNVDMDNTGITVGEKTTITDGNINLGGDNGTNINADGMTVGAGTDIKDGNITVTGNEGKVEIGKGDVAIFDENGEKVTSIQHNYDEINRVEEKFDGEVNRLDNRISKVEDRIDKVGAMSAAIANLRTMGYDPAAPTEIAVGVGQYRSETGVALGMFHYPNKDFMLSLSVSTSGDEVMGGIGATWKFGRKSPEKVLAAEKEKAAKAKLAKAEAMKKAAKEAKIKAQQERHAKLAAERAAQAEAAK